MAQPEAAPQQPTPARTAIVALAPVLVSALALTVMLLVGSALEATHEPAPSGVIDLGPLMSTLVVGGGAGATVWLIGLGIVVGTLFPAGRRARVWWTLVGAGGAALLAGARVVPMVLPVSMLVGGWIAQQVVLVGFALDADRRIGRPRAEAPGVLG